MILDNKCLGARRLKNFTTKAPIQLAMSSNNSHSNLLFLSLTLDRGKSELRIAYLEKKKEQKEEATKPAPKKTYGPRACQPSVKRSHTKKIGIAVPERQLSNQGTVQDLNKMLEGAGIKNQPQAMQRLL